MRNAFIVSAVLLIGTLLPGCSAQGQKARAADSTLELRPVIVQGAMDLEVKKFASRLENVRVEKVGGWTFWRGTLDGYPVIVSKTMKGVSNSAVATVIAAERYHPVAIVNQGTAGGHVRQLHVYDIVLGKYSENIGAFKTAYRKSGQGSDFREWKPLDLMASEGSAGEDPNEQIMRRFKGDEQLLASAESVKHLYRKGRVVEGLIGSGETWNSELDRIQWWIVSSGFAQSTAPRSRKWKLRQRRRLPASSRFRFSVSGCCPITSPTPGSMTPKRAKLVRIMSTTW